MNLLQLINTKSLSKYISLFTFQAAAIAVTCVRWLWRRPPRWRSTGGACTRWGREGSIAAGSVATTLIMWVTTVATSSPTQERSRTYVMSVGNGSVRAGRCSTTNVQCTVRRGDTSARSAGTSSLRLNLWTGTLRACTIKLRSISVWSVRDASPVSRSWIGTWRHTLASGNTSAITVITHASVLVLLKSTS